MFSLPLVSISDYLYVKSKLGWSGKEFAHANANLQPSDEVVVCCFQTEDTRNKIVFIFCSFHHHVIMLLLQNC